MRRTFSRDAETEELTATVISVRLPNGYTSSWNGLGWRPCKVAPAMFAVPQAEAYGKLNCLNGKRLTRF